VRSIGESISAGRQHIGECARPEEVLLAIRNFLDGKQDAGYSAFSRRDEKVPAGGRLKPGGVRECPGRGVEAVPMLPPIRGIYEPHRNGRCDFSTWQKRPMHARPFLKPAASTLSVTNEDVHETEWDPAPVHIPSMH
jgi:hypothetical protein